ncbi:universal stress protein [Mesorhizobium sp. M0340]|uniref:universal stress protein n=1 Tax=Mesorhizobium sp. M0340 TaxID=2956939 RepID=UPI00333C8CB3
MSYRSARAADLIVTGGDKGEAVYRAADIGSLVLGTGRPVLAAASQIEDVMAKAVLVAWKDTREARRALTDALPFLAKANDVVIATIDSERDDGIRDSLADVAVFLEHHGIMARTEFIRGDADGEHLLAVARSINADLIVSGAYGHSRLRVSKKAASTASCRIDLRPYRKSAIYGIHARIIVRREPVDRDQCSGRRDDNDIAGNGSDRHDFSRLPDPN